MDKPQFIPLKTIRIPHFEPVVMSATGDALMPIVKLWEADLLKDDLALPSHLARHTACGGVAARRAISETHAAFSCNTCYGRFTYPANLKTWGDLRAWSIAKFGAGP